ncbi:MAG: class I tRNA ligase family protein, partial [Candidatus Omnitrophica bacterium]|nr:class I tRNA ligase family protein [Candidatus Omnitrophota bacterium]
EFCDWYLEIIKTDIKKPQNQVVMYKILEKFMRILHPFMPFVTEEIWQKVRGQSSIMIQPWPHLQEEIIEKKHEKSMESVFEVITAIRNMRSELDIPLQDDIPVCIYAPRKKEKELLGSCATIIKSLSKAQTLEFKETYTRQAGQFVMALKYLHIVIPLSNIIDIDAYRKKTEEKLIRAEAEIKRKKELLENKAFSKNAPAEIVEKEKEKLNELDELVKKLKAVKDAFQ